MISALKQITTRAKQIRKKQKSITWKQAIKKASAEYRGGSIKRKKAIARKPVKRKAAKKAKAKHIDTKSHNVNIRVLSGAPNMYSTRDHLEAKAKQTALWIQSMKGKKDKPTRSLIKHTKKHLIALKKAIRAENIHINSLFR
jgi:hypothetical protein